MNFSLIIGLFITSWLLLTAIMLGAPLVVFFDIYSVLIVVGGTAFMTLATHGMTGLITLHKGTMHAWFPDWFPLTDWGTTEYQVVAQVARTGGTAAILMATCGGLIGLNQMLVNLDDPTKIGPAMAVCLLTAFYAVVMNLLVFIPMSRYYTEAALDEQAPA